jgi:hypothetical protein
LSTTRILPIPRGRFQVLDSYAFFKLTDQLSVGGELDLVTNRQHRNAAVERVTGGAAYLRYQLSPRTYFAQRYTRFNDRDGLFSGLRQNLNDLTSTLSIQPSEGFEARLEYRRDFSNRPFFLRTEPGSLSTQQNTFTLGLLWWFGGKTGSW